MGKKRKDDGVVRIVTDETPTIQATLPVEEEESSDETLGETRSATEEAEPASTLAAVDSDQIEAAEVPHEPAELAPIPSGMDAPFADGFVNDVIEPEPSDVVTGSHEVLVERSTAPYGNTYDPAMEFFNPRVWELEKTVQDLTDRISSESAKRVADLAESVALSEAMLNDLRSCKLWSIKTTQTRVPVLVLAHNAVEAIQKATAHQGHGVDAVTEVRPVADFVVI